MYDRRQSRVVTTNPIHWCEEFEDAMSVYDDTNDQCQYDDLNEHTMQLDVLADQAQERDQHDKPPELPLPRESVYLEVLQDESSIRGSEPPTPRPDAKSDHGSMPAAGYSTSGHDISRYTPRRPLRRSEDGRA